jgi:hypothetical protein
MHVLKKKPPFIPSRDTPAVRWVTTKENEVDRISRSRKDSCPARRRALSKGSVKANTSRSIPCGSPSGDYQQRSEGKKRFKGKKTAGCVPLGFDFGMILMSNRSTSFLGWSRE